MNQPEMPKGCVKAGWIFAALCLFFPFSCAYGQITDALKPLPAKAAPLPTEPDTTYVVPKDVVIRSYQDAPSPETTSDANDTTDLSGYTSPLSVGGTSGGSYRSPGRSADGAPKTVHVRGYTRKDGTYVQPHSRRSPRRH